MARPPAVLLGPQPEGGKQVGDVLRALGVQGQVALITAGWQEYEREDAALRGHIDAPTVNLELYTRSEVVFAADPELEDEHKARQTQLRQIQACYRVRLESTDDAANTVAVRHMPQALVDDELAVSIEMFRYLDREHADRCAQVHAEFRARAVLHARPAYTAHVAELRAVLGDSEAVVITGGHVGALLSRLNLFRLGDLMAERPDRPVIGWSAGAMALTDRVICFHDFPPYGQDVAQFLDAGLGFAPGVVVLPDPRRRVRLDDVDGIARFARRMAPASCFALDVGADLRFAEGATQPTGHAEHLCIDGRVDQEWSV